MALYPSYFYHGTIKKYITIFGALFNNMFIKQKIGEDSYQQIHVPIAFSPKQPYIARLEQDPNLERDSAIVLPRMGYEIMNYSYDVERKINRYNQIRICDDTNPQVTFAPVPYNINFNLYAFTRTKDEGFQIVEQIIPFFNPELTLSIKNLIPNIDPIDISISLDPAIVEDDNYEVDYMTKRTIIWTLGFMMKGYFFTPVSDVSGNIIKKIFVNFYTDSDASNTELESSEDITIWPGLTANGEGTYNANLAIDYNLVNKEDPYYVIIEHSSQ